MENKTADQIMDEEFCDSMFQVLEPLEIKYIKDAMKIIAELSFDAGQKHGYELPSLQMRLIDLSYAEHPNKDQFIQQLFPNQ